MRPDGIYLDETSQAARISTYRRSGRMLTLGQYMLNLGLTVLIMYPVQPRHCISRPTTTCIAKICDNLSDQILPAILRSEDSVQLAWIEYKKLAFFLSPLFLFSSFYCRAVSLPLSPLIILVIVPITVVFSLAFCFSCCLLISTLSYAAQPEVNSFPVLLCNCSPGLTPLVWSVSKRLILLPPCPFSTQSDF